MSREELIGHARAIKDFCMERSECTDCPFSYDIGTGCKLTDLDDYPTRWDLPEEEGNRQKTEWECEA